MNGSNSSWSYASRDASYRYGSQYSDCDNRNNSAISKMQHHYWVTKETVFRKLGKKDDKYIVASDAELDAKLELFRAIQESCLDLQRVIDKYQERICFLAQEENTMGRFLKEAGKQDKTGAGSMMHSVGKTLTNAGQQRISLRMPLLRLYQEVDTFRHRAIEDTLRTIQSMEKSRTEFRASLSWMKDISQALDPDTYKQLEKFRTVQEHVKVSKARFDRLKIDCLEKIDLLAAAWCNMFSQGLIGYHNTMTDLAAKSAQAFTTVAESFHRLPMIQDLSLETMEEGLPIEVKNVIASEHQHFEFNIVKELSEMKPEPATVQSTEEDHDDKIFDFDEPKPEASASASASETQPVEGLLIQTDSPRNELTSLFMPSEILLQNVETQNFKTPGPNESQDGPRSSKTSWLELFSELDPLSNPDSIGQSDEPQRNC